MDDEPAESDQGITASAYPVYYCSVRPTGKRFFKFEWKVEKSLTGNGRYFLVRWGKSRNERDAIHAAHNWANEQRITDMIENDVSKGWRYV